jgi:hypothetical protein
MLHLVCNLAAHDPAKHLTGARENRLHIALYRITLISYYAYTVLRQYPTILALEATGSGRPEKLNAP